MLTGGCHCGAVRYQVDGAVHHHALCHCSDCQRSAGAPVVAWIAFDANALTVTQGTPTRYASSQHGERHFCPHCGTGLFYYNPVNLPGIVDVQSATLDAGSVVPPPAAHIQYAEAAPWMESIHTLPRFARYPGME